MLSKLLCIFYSIYLLCLLFVNIELICKILLNTRAKTLVNFLKFWKLTSKNRDRSWPLNTLLGADRRSIATIVQKESGQVTNLLCLSIVVALQAGSVGAREGPEAARCAAGGHVHVAAAR